MCRLVEIRGKRWIEFVDDTMETTKEKVQHDSGHDSDKGCDEDSESNDQNMQTQFEFMSSF